MASSYRDTLDSSDRVRYDAKLSMIGNRDPYAFEQSDWIDDVSFLPSTTYIGIMNYLVFLPSPYTMEDLRAQKNFRPIQSVCLRMGQGQGEIAVPKRRLLCCDSQSV